MSKKISIIVLVLVSFILQSCKSASSQPVETQIATRVSQTPDVSQKKIISEQSDGKVEFKGVSFSYNPQIFGKVKAEEVVEFPLGSKDEKPDYVAPQHRLFTFDLSTEFSEMYLAVYPINEFPRMYAVDKSSVKAMEKEIRDLKKVLRDKNFRVENEIPFLRYYDASQTFQQKVKHFPFQGGKGILFLTFWVTQAELPSNRQLRYVYQGLTEDEKYYVSAETPVSVAFLPKESSEEYEGYKVPWGKFNDKAEMKHFEAVKEKIGKRLENLPQNGFSPNLKYFEEIIASLKVEK